MSFADISYGDLPENREEAFVAFAAQLTDAYEVAQRQDREYNTDHNGNYEGSFEPERTYTTLMLAFIDELELEVEVADISNYEQNFDFYKQFGKFKSKIEYAVARFKLRIAKQGYLDNGTPVQLETSFKQEISKNLSAIRKLVDENVTNETKKEDIYTKISALQLEIDKDRTSIDALFGRAIDVAQGISNVAEKLDPALERMERIKSILFERTKKQSLLPKPDRKIAIEDKTKETTGQDLDDEIPF